MAGNTFGNIFRLTTFGESHGYGIGGVIDGCPSGIVIDDAFIQEEVDRRKPVKDSGGTGRMEDDRVEFVSGIFEGKATGTPIAFIIRNAAARSGDYERLKDVYRPSHADYTYEAKYGIRDYRGGGRASGRETVSRVVAGAVAKLVLKPMGISIHAFISQVGNVFLDKDYASLDTTGNLNGPLPCPDPEISENMRAEIEKARSEGETVGGKISCMIKNIPAGLGEPVFDKFEADLAKAMLSIGAVKGFEIGSGFNASGMRGSEYNDRLVNKEGRIRTLTNNDGGVQGGISNGEDIFFSVAFKPVPTVMKEQETTGKNGNPLSYKVSGRHDVCIVPRAVVIVESMAALVAVDHLLRQQAARKV